MGADTAGIASQGAWGRRLLAWLGFGGPSTVHRRVRLGLYSVLLLAGGTSLWQIRHFESSEAVRSSDLDIVRLADTQLAQARLLGMLLARTGARPAQWQDEGDALQQGVDRLHTLAASLDRLLARQGVWQIEGRPQLRTAILAWQDERELVWARAQAVRGAAQSAPAGAWREATRDLQAELDRYAATVQQMADELQGAARDRAQAALDRIRSYENLTVGVLLLLFTSVVEPLVLFVRRQSHALLDQSVQAQRLALVAQRTSNWVAVVDRRRRVLWANDAFLRGKGQTLAEALGKHPGLVRANAGNDAAEMERLLTELDNGLGVRADIMFDAPNGREIWLDLDYQPIHDDAGVLAGFTLVASDVTESVNQRARLRTVLDALPVGYVLYSAQGVVLDCNDQALTILGRPREALIGRNRIEELHTMVRADLTPMPQQERPIVVTLRTGEPVRDTLVGYVHETQGLRWHLANTAPVRDASGKINGVISCMIDVTQQRDQQQMLALAVESASLGIWQWDITTGRMSVNDQFLDLFGYRGEEPPMTAEAFNALIHPDDLEGWRWAIRSNLKDSSLPLHWEVRIRHRDGRWVWALFSGTVVARDASGQALRMGGISYDIHAHKELEDQLRRTARTDSLTRLPNRLELLGRIHNSLQQARQQPGYGFAVLFMDFDRFKQVNDTLGHSVGDELLRQIAQRLQDSLRPGDAFVQTSDFRQLAARIGGDEFVVLLDNIRGDLDAQVVASRLLDVLAEPYLIGTHRLTSSASIGIVTNTHMAEDPDSVLRDADIAMYEAKRQGRGRFVMFDPSMRKRVHDDVELESDLRLALERGDLHVVYQPMIDLANGRLLGVEALARWQHPTRGPVSPLTFIPIAEASGLIGRLGDFVLKTACHELVRLHRLLGACGPQTVSVNLSRAQLREAGFTARLSELLYGSGLAPGALVLEVTESLAAQDEGMQAILREIRGLGVSLSLDDFGTGYSSLSCLHELPVNQVKIDRSFVSLALGSDYHRVMIEATIRMAQTLGLQTVAEGIETQEQAELMARLGCTKGQGYLYSAPLPAPEFEPWALAWRDGADKAG